MKHTTPPGLLLATALTVLAACSPGESADNPPGSAVGNRSAAAAPATPTSHTLAAGTLVDAVINDTINSRHAIAGDAFTARVAEDVRDSGDRVAIPAGSTVHGIITDVSPADNSRSTGTLTLAISSVTVDGSTYDMDASIDALETIDEGRGIESGDVARVVGGAAAGAIIGQVIGGNTKGTIIGGVVGGVAGAAVSVAIKDVDIVLPAGSRLKMTLRQPLTVMVR
jgi:hypothetical protein